MKKTMMHVLLAVLVCGMSLSLVCAEIIVAPNPWIPDDTRPNRGTLAEGMKFLNVPAEGDLCIYTMSGSFVKRIEFTASTTRPVAWLGKNADDEYVASGVYLWVIKSGGTVQSGKVIVIR
jgi:hypothetical protein